MKWPVALLVAALAVAGVPARAAVIVVQAEAGRIENPLCGDTATEQMVADGEILFFPAERCRAVYDPARLAGATRLRRLVAVTFWMTGNGSDPDDLHCGHFELTGGVLGASPPRCAGPGEVVTVAIHATPRAGPWTLTWMTDDGTPSHVNAFVDYLTGR